MRLVITKRNSATAGAPDGIATAVPYDSYRERLVKYVPVEIIVLYVATYGILYYAAGADPWFSLVALWLLVAGIVAVPLYLWNMELVCDGIQIAISITGFALFAFALGVIPLSAQPGYNQIVASVALPVYVFISPLFEGKPDRW